MFLREIFLLKDDYGNVSVVGELNHLEDIIKEFKDFFPNDICLKGLLYKEDSYYLKVYDCMTKHEFDDMECALTYTERLFDLNYLIKSDLKFIKN